MLFLDEIGLRPENLQAKLLTVLEDRAVRRLGSTRTEAVDAWIISAKRMLALPTSSFVSVQHLVQSRSVIVVTIVTVIERGARRDEQVGESGTGGSGSVEGTVRVEVETSAVEGQGRALLETCGIDGRPQVYRRRPGIRRAGSRRNPYVAASGAVRAIRGEEQLEPVSSDGWLFVLERRVEVRNGDSRGELPIFVECASEEITGERLPRPDRVEV
jgi:hypothetical protein